MRAIECRLFVSPDAKLRWPPLRGEPPTRLEVYSRGLEVARSLGAIAQLNHPNFHFAADAKLTLEVMKRGALLLEIANQAHDSGNEGDARHPSTEALWDAVLTAGAWPVYGVASDDAHHYNDAAEADEKIDAGVAQLGLQRRALEQALVGVDLHHAVVELTPDDAPGPAVGRGPQRRPEPDVVDGDVALDVGRHGQRPRLRPARAADAAVLRAGAP